MTMDNAARYSDRVSKAEWYAAGGFATSNCWRRQRKDGRWIYYIVRDNDE